MTTSSDTSQPTSPRLGGLAFRWRSYLPLLCVLGLLIGLGLGAARSSEYLRLMVAFGLSLAVAGLAIRTYAVGHAPPGTSGRHRRQYAVQLNTFGIYSIVRHPLYLGNLLVWVGVSLASGWPLGALVSSLAGLGLFALIIRHEDAFLAATFQSSFAEWRQATPALWPRLSLWRTARRPFRWAKAVASEYSTLHSIGLLALLFAAARGWSAGRPLPTPGWWWIAALNSALYLIVRALRRRWRAQPAGHP